MWMDIWEYVEVTKSNSEKNSREKSDLEAKVIKNTVSWNLIDVNWR